MKLLVRIILVGLVLGVGLGTGTAATDQPITVVFLTWKPNQPEVWNELIGRFHQAHPDIKIKIQIGPHSSTEYHAIVTQRLKNKDPSVDVFFMDVIWPPEFANAGWALDLGPLFPPEERDRFLPGPIAANTYKGKIYGVPCYLAAGLFYYRRDLLDKYGFKPPGQWPEMLDQGRVILSGEKDPDLKIYSGQFKQYEGLVCNMLEFLWSHGGAVLDPSTGKSRLAAPEALEALAFVREKIIGRAAPVGAVNYEEPESLELFIQGKAVFHRNWPYAYAVADDPAKSKVAGRVGVTSLPAFPGHSPASTLGGWQFGLSRWSKRPEEAWKFVHFMTSPESQKLLALKAGLAPTRRAVYQDREVRTAMPHLLEFLPSFEQARPRPLSPVYPMISQELQRYFSRAIVDKEADLAALAQATAAKIEKLARLGAAVQP